MVKIYNLRTILEKTKNIGKFYFSNLPRRKIAIFIVFLLAIFFFHFSISYNFFGNSESKQSQPESNFSVSEEKFSKNKIYGAFPPNNIRQKPIVSSGKENYSEVSNDSNKNGAENASNSGKLPKLLEIPKIAVSAKVQYVGLNSKNEMDVPSNNTDVAWFALGAAPGDIGSAVIAGHLDKSSWKPAVFWNLGKLIAGDEVYVVDNDNNKKRFQVMSVQTYETDAAPMEKIFGASDGAYLNLVTCGGAWDKTKHNYIQRVVVFTKHSPL